MAASSKRTTTARSRGKVHLLKVLVQPVVVTIVDGDVTEYVLPANTVPSQEWTSEFVDRHRSELAKITVEQLEEAASQQRAGGA